MLSLLPNLPYTIKVSLPRETILINSENNVRHLNNCSMLDFQIRILLKRNYDWNCCRNYWHLKYLISKRSTLKMYIVFSPPVYMKDVELKIFCKFRKELCYILCSTAFIWGSSMKLECAKRSTCKTTEFKWRMSSFVAFNFMHKFNLFMASSTSSNWFLKITNKF